MRGRRRVLEVAEEEEGELDLLEGEARDAYIRRLREATALDVIIPVSSFLLLIAGWLLTWSVWEYWRLAGMEFDDPDVELIWRRFNQYSFYTEIIFFPMHLLYDSIFQDPSPEINA